MSELSTSLPFIVAGLGVVLIGLWIWLVPAKGRSLPQDAESDQAPAPSVAAAVDQPVQKAAATPKAKSAPKAKVKSAAPKATVAKAAAPKDKPKAAPKAKSVSKAGTASVTAKAPSVKASAKPAAKAAAKAAPEEKAKKPASPKASEKTAPAAKAKAAPAPKPKTEAKPKAATKPKAAAKPKASTGPDNLLLIKGLGPKLQTALNAQGITRFDQIAAWKAADIAAIDAKLGAFAGRIQRDQFVAQARLLAKGDIAAFEATYGKLDAPMT